MSLNGLKAVNQNSGDNMTIMVAKSTRRGFISRGPVLPSPLNNPNRANANSAPESALQIASPLVSGADT